MQTLEDGDELDRLAMPYATARAAGITESVLRGAQWHHISHGWLTKVRSLTFVQRCRAFADLLPANAAFSDTTALALIGVPTPPFAARPDAPLHIAVPPGGRRPRRKELVVHRRLFDQDSDVVTSQGVRHTTAERTFVDLASYLRAEELVAVGDSLLRARMATVATLRGRLLQAVRARNRSNAFDLLGFLDPRAQSWPESILRFRLFSAGFAFQAQCQVKSIDGELLGHDDLGAPAARIAVEYEGRQHAQGDQFRRDIGRYSVFAAAGWLVLRASSADLQDSAPFIRKVAAAFRSRAR